MVKIIGALCYYLGKAALPPPCIPSHPHPAFTPIITAVWHEERASIMWKEPLLKRYRMHIKASAKKTFFVLPFPICT